jgi:phosphoribosylaminoimidazolecarboxamide formyltransferase/IMP cyclohydrolase
MALDKDMSELRKRYSTASEGSMPDKMQISFSKESSLRYGENPGQDGALYGFLEPKMADSFGMELVKSGKGGPSATNIMDFCRALDILKFFERAACAVMKHCIPSGFAVENKRNKLVEIYKNARDCDSRSAFGSVVVFNCDIDLETAEEIVSTYVEEVAATGFAEGVLDIFSQKKNLRVIRYSNLDKIAKFKGDTDRGILDIKTMSTGRAIVQKPFLSEIRSAEDLVVQPALGDIKAEKIPNDRELQDMLTAWYVNIGTRSNGVVIVKDGVTLAIGSGKQERVRAVSDAIVTSYQKAMAREGIEHDELMGIMGKDRLLKNPLDGAVLSSDGFIPFSDTIELCARCGISAIVEPGGSVRDSDVILAANKHGISLVFTKERCFGHF